VSLIKKTDVKNHLSPRHRRIIHLVVPASQPDATGFSGEQSDGPDSNGGNTAGELLPQHGIAMPEARPLEAGSELKPFAAPAIAKDAKI
jgi:hypothetical protein